MSLLINLKDKYGKLNTHDLWKFFATIFMLIDHFGLYAFQNQDFRLIGRLAFPIFAILYGYHFKNKLNYRLFIWGLPIIVTNYFLGINFFFLNILYSFFFGSLIIKLYNKSTEKDFDKMVFITVLLLFHYIFRGFFEYGSFAPLFMFIAVQKGKFKIFAFVSIFLVYFFEQNIVFSFNFIRCLLLFALLLVEGILLYNYKLKTIKINNIFLDNSIKLIARYSLEFYTIQTCLFKIFYIFK